MNEPLCEQCNEPERPIALSSSRYKPAPGCTFICARCTRINTGTIKQRIAERSAMIKRKILGIKKNSKLRR